MSEQPKFSVQEVTVPDPDIWPTDWQRMVRRYALVDQKGTTWLNGRQFGSVRTMQRADRTTYDCRYLFRKSKAEAWLDLIRWPLNRDEDLVWQCMYSSWDIWPELIFECGSVTPVIEAYFETSGSSVIRDFGWEKWLQHGIETFGEALREPAKRWAEHTDPKYMPTSYESEPRLKAQHYANIRATAQEILRQLAAVSYEQ